MTDNETEKKGEHETGHTKYGVECDPKKPLPEGEKTATEGCPKCGGGHDDVEGDDAE